MENERGRGEFRELTSDEIAGGISRLRKSMGWKQLTLAHEAGVTERTIQRLEAAHKTDDETLRKVAKGLRLKEDAFVGARYIPTDEEALDKTERELADFMRRFIVVDLRALSSFQDFDRILGAHAHVIEDQQVDITLAETIAAFRDGMQDWMDIYADMTEIDKLRARKEMFDWVEDIKSNGYAARLGVYTTDDHFDVAVIVFVDSKDWHRCGLTQMIVPRRFDQWLSGVHS